MDPLPSTMLSDLAIRATQGELDEGVLKCAIVQAITPVSETDAREVREIVDQLAQLMGPLGLEVVLFYLHSQCHTHAPLHLAAKRAREMLAAHVDAFDQWTPHQRRSGALGSAIAVDGRIYALSLAHANLNNLMKMCLGRLYALYRCQYSAFLANATTKMVAHCWQCADGGACQHEIPPFKCRRVHYAATSARVCPACTGGAWCAPHRDAIIDSTPALRYMDATNACAFGKTLATAADAC